MRTICFLVFFPFAVHNGYGILAVDGWARLGGRAKELICFGI
jgi:hypothetical protein